MDENSAGYTALSRHASAYQRHACASHLRHRSMACGLLCKDCLQNLKYISAQEEHICQKHGSSVGSRISPTINTGMSKRRIPGSGLKGAELFKAIYTLEELERLSR